jgi:hypothetical protein
LSSVCTQCVDSARPLQDCFSWAETRGDDVCLNIWCWNVTLERVTDSRVSTDNRIQKEDNSWKRRWGYLQRKLETKIRVMILETVSCIDEFEQGKGRNYYQHLRWRNRIFGPSRRYWNHCQFDVKWLRMWRITMLGHDSGYKRLTKSGKVMLWSAEARETLGPNASFPNLK